MTLPLLSNIYHSKQKNLILDIILSKVNSDLKIFLKNFNNIFFLQNLGTKFNPNNKISKNDEDILKKIKNTKYDICFVMRRNLNYENLKIMQVVNANKKYICIENTPLNKEFFATLNKTKTNWVNVYQDQKNINNYVHSLKKALDGETVDDIGIREVFSEIADDGDRLKTRVFKLLQPEEQTIVSEVMTKTTKEAA